VETNLPVNDSRDQGQTTSPTQSLSAVHDLSSHLRLWPVAAAGLALDLWSKWWAFTHLDPDPRHAMTVVPGLVTFRRTLNDGALFGLGKGLWIVFILASIAALAFVWYLFAHSTRDRRSLHVGLAMILAGALGNLYDRAFVVTDVVRTDRGSEAGIVLDETEHYIELATWPDKRLVRRIPRSVNPVVQRQGVVRDFIKIEPQFGWIEIWPWVFNVADVLLVVGVALLLLNFWWDRRAARSVAEAAAAKQPAPATTPGANGATTHRSATDST
jgi:lipoprotein signal peptidase